MRVSRREAVLRWHIRIGTSLQRRSLFPWLVAFWATCEK